MKDPNQIPIVTVLDLVANGKHVAYSFYETFFSRSSLCLLNPHHVMVCHHSGLPTRLMHNHCQLSGFDLGIDHQALAQHVSHTCLRWSARFRDNHGKLSWPSLRASPHTFVPQAIFFWALHSSSWSCINQAADSHLIPLDASNDSMVKISSWADQS